MSCPLCFHGSNPLFENYFHCPQCDLRFLDPKYHLTPEQEKQRYLSHNNDVTDKRYQKFVSPLVDEVKAHCVQGSCGLDFGSGSGPVLAMLLKENGYQVEMYDPYFCPNPSVLEKYYDFIVSCEVIEHFYSPHVEFTKLKKLLKNGGVLGVMTSIYSEEIDFENWYYRRDPSHVVFYSKKTLQWIAKSFGFQSVNIKLPNVITFQN